MVKTTIQGVDALKHPQRLYYLLGTVSDVLYGANTLGNTKIWRNSLLILEKQWLLSIEKQTN